MAAEIERKFRLAEQPKWLESCESERIEQGYLALEAEIEVRLRRGAQHLSLTVKRGRGLTREEREIELDRDRFEALWPLTEGRRLIKRRFRRPAPEGCFEIDVYDGDLTGLVVAEIEFDDERSSAEFEPPDWLEVEVTGEDRYSNRELAVDGLPPGALG